MFSKLNVAFALSCASCSVVSAEHLVLTKKIVDENPGSFSSVAFSADGSKIVAGSGSQARVWNAETGDILNLKNIPLSDNFVTSVAFNKDGTRVLTGIQCNGTPCLYRIGVWDIGNEDEPLERIAPNTDGDVSLGAYSVAYNSDESKILEIGSDIKVWNAADGSLLQTIVAPTSYDARVDTAVVTSSPDGSKS